MNITHIAQKTRLSRMTVWRVLNGKNTPRLSTARKLAEALNVTIEEIEALRQEDKGKK